MTPAQGDFLREITEKLDAVTELQSTNAMHIAVLTEAVATLKDVTARLSDCYDNERSRGDECRRDVARDIAGLGYALRDELSTKAAEDDLRAVAVEVKAKADAAHFERVEDMVLAVRRWVFVGMGVLLSVQSMLVVLVATGVIHD